MNLYIVLVAVVVFLVLKVILKQKLTLVYICQKHLQWHVNNRNKKQVKKMSKHEKKVRENLRILYEFVRWITEKGLQNRHERKNFYKKVLDGEPIIEEHLKHILENYKKKDEVQKEQKKNSKK